MQVTTSRSKCNFKPAIVCLEDPLSKLEGLGSKTINRLQHVQQCIQKHDTDGTVPETPIDKVETGRPSMHKHCACSFSHSMRFVTCRFRVCSPACKMPEVSEYFAAVNGKCCRQAGVSGKYSCMATCM